MLGGQKNRKREDRDDGHRGLRLAAAIVAGTALLSTGAAAQTQSWRHGIIEPKSDAGFQVMAVRAGFAAKEGIKLELPISRTTSPHCADTLEWLQGELIKAGNLTQPYDLARVVNAEVRTQALARAGM
jgi:hypothetical protein